MTCTFSYEKWCVGIGVVLLFASLLVMAVPAYGASAAEYGEAQPLVSSSPTPVGVAVDKHGTVYWVNYDTGQLLAMPRSPALPVAVLLSGLNHPQDVAVDAAGNLYYTEYYPGTVSVLPAGSRTSSVLIRGLSYPTAISADSAGNLFVIEGVKGWLTCSHRIVRYDHAYNTTITVILKLTDADRGFGDVFIHPSGDLYYTTCRTGTIERLSRGSSTPEILLNTSRPTIGITMDSYDNIFFTDYASEVNILPKGASVSTPLLSRGSSRYLIVPDSEGNIYYSDSINGIIWRIPHVSPPPTATTQTVTTTQTLTATVTQTSTLKITETATSTGSLSVVTSTLTSTQHMTETMTTSKTVTTSATQTLPPIVTTVTTTQPETQTKTVTQVRETGSPSSVLVSDVGLLYLSIGLVVLGMFIAIGLRRRQSKPF